MHTYAANEPTSTDLITVHGQTGRMELPIKQLLRQTSGFEQRNGPRGTQQFVYRGHSGVALLSGHEVLFRINSITVRMTMENASASVRLSSEQWRVYNVNYLLGSDPAAWKTGIPVHRAVKYTHLYPGIDAEFHDRGEDLELDFLVSPSAEPRNIRLAFKGASVTIDKTGGLLVTAGGRSVRLKRPEAYQEIRRTRNEVESHFVLYGDQSVGINVGNYNRRLPLIIDPTIAYGTYIGGSGAEDAHKVAVDQFGHAYIVGTALLPTDLAATSGAFQGSSANQAVIFVAKISSQGDHLEYLTFLGGVDPTKESDGFDIAVDQAGSAYVCGVTTDGTYPTSLGAVQSKFKSQAAVITKLTPNGDGLRFSTFLAGSAGNGATALALDGANNVYVTGFVTSPDFPVTPNVPQSAFGGLEDGFVAKLSPDGSQIIYATYIGGSSLEGPNFYIAADSAGNAYVTGHTLSSDFPTTPGVFKTVQRASGNLGGNAFIVRLNPAGTSFTYSTLLGSDSLQNGVEPSGIAVDSQGSAVVAGTTNDAQFPVTAGVYQSVPAGVFQNVSSSAFVAKLSSDGSKLMFSSLFGGAGLNAATAVALDAQQNIVLVGETTSPFFPTTSDGSGPPTGGLHGFLSVLDSTASNLLFSSVIAGSGNDQPFGLAIGSTGEIFVSGFTSSTDFPTTSHSAQTAYGGGSRDGFILKFTDGFLTFPLRGTTPGVDQSLTASTAPIISVFDHSMKSRAGNYEIYSPSKPDGVVQAFSTDKGIGDPEHQGCYSNGDLDFSGGIPNYVGPRSLGTQVLCYDNHPGIDFRAAFGTEVYAAVSGTIHYPYSIVGITKNNAAFYKYHVLELKPDTPLPYRIFYLHLSTHPATGVQVTRVDSSGSPCPAMVTLPLAEGTHVTAGCLVALSGAAGAPNGPHLHFEVHKVISLENAPAAIRPAVACPDDQSKACIPVDPYGWLGKIEDDPYKLLTGIVSTRLWR